RLGECRTPPQLGRPCRVLPAKVQVTKPGTAPIGGVTILGTQVAGAATWWESRQTARLSAIDANIACERVVLSAGTLAALGQRVGQRFMGRQRCPHFVKDFSPLIRRCKRMLRKLRRNRAFTLVELMIVVAIVGLLAALAIYGVRKYMTNAKTTEARNALGQISKGAQISWDRELTAAEDLEPGKKSEDSGRKLCPDAPKVPADANFPKGG